MLPLIILTLSVPEMDVASGRFFSATSAAKETLENSDYRRVLYTAKHSQLVLMSLKPGEEIGMEVRDAFL